MGFHHHGEVNSWPATFKESYYNSRDRRINRQHTNSQFVPSGLGEIINTSCSFRYLEMG